MPAGGIKTLLMLDYKRIKTDKGHVRQLAMADIAPRLMYGYLHGLQRSTERNNGSADG